MPFLQSGGSISSGSNGYQAPVVLRFRRARYGPKSVPSVSESTSIPVFAAGMAVGCGHTILTALAMLLSRQARRIADSLTGIGWVEKLGWLVFLLRMRRVGNGIVRLLRTLWLRGRRHRLLRLGLRPRLLRLGAGPVAAAVGDAGPAAGCGAPGAPGGGAGGFSSGCAVCAAAVWSEMVFVARRIFDRSFGVSRNVSSCLCALSATLTQPALMKQHARPVKREPSHRQTDDQRNVNRLAKA